MLLFRFLWSPWLPSLRSSHCRSYVSLASICCLRLLARSASGHRPRPRDRALSQLARRPFLVSVSVAWPRAEIERSLPPPPLEQGSAKEWSLGCVIPASWPPLAAGAGFTQPKNHSLADPCITVLGSDAYCPLAPNGAFFASCVFHNM